MIEIYRGDAEEVELRIYSGGQRVNSAVPVEVEVFDHNYESVDAGTATLVEPVDSGESHNYYTFLIDSELTETGDRYTIKWSFEPVFGVEASRTDEIRIVRPYVYVDQIRTEFPNLANRSFKELKHIERLVRYSIDAFTGQSFIKEFGTSYSVTGTGGRTLLLPKRCLHVNSVHGESDDVTEYVKLQRDRWALSFAHPSKLGYVNVKADIGLNYASPRQFHSGYYYTVNGNWGWEHVPGEIEQAASILVGRFNEPEQNWRRYNVDVVRANDWRMEFNKTSGETTGDADADLMLIKYKAPFYGVI